MRFTKYLSIIIIISLLCSFCSCTKGEKDLKLNISESDKTLVDLATKIYSDSQLSQIVNYEVSINELNDKFPIECLREEQTIYRVSYLGEGKIAVILFDDSGNKLTGTIYNAKKTKSDFDKLTKGKSLEDVRAIDPDGEYLFLYSGRNDLPRVSSHYTKDGYLITIEYDDLNTIISISEKLT